MTSTLTDESTRLKPLRLWPGVLIVALQWFGRFILPVVVPEAGMYGVLGGLAGGLAVIVWWAFFSRAPGSERWGGVALIIAALAATPFILHESIRTGGMGMLFFMYAVPLVSLAFVAWAVVSRRLATGPRWAAMVASVVIACGVWALVQSGGFTGEGDSDFSWRWAMTAEERLLAQTAEAPTAILPVEAPTPAPAPVIVETRAKAAPELELGTGTDTEVDAQNDVEIEAAQPPVVEEAVADWPGFRGPTRDGVVRGVRIETDWSATPPVELWRRPIGPGWSSFAANDGVLYTQEQRGEDEIVSSYDLATGEPVWTHRDAERFWESNAGAGPRGTPALSGGHLYTLGATGIVNALDGADGTVIWSHSAASDGEAKLPMWAFSGSPLVVDDLLIVAASGSLVAYDRGTGEVRWSRPGAGEGYSSPQLLTFDGRPQVLQLSGAGAVSVAAADGSLLWEHPWKGFPIVQPLLTADGDVLISASQQSGLRRLAVDRAGGIENAEMRGSGAWTLEERWTTTRLKPYYSDIVIHQGHAFGFDGSILAALDLETGERKWKGGRYGAGQLLLLADQGLLLVLSEAGELVLVEADPERFSEVARFPAIEGKTWNHPALVGDVLLVRNAEEMAAFRLTLAAP